MAKKRAEVEFPSRLQEIATQLDILQRIGVDEIINMKVVDDVSTLLKPGSTMYILDVDDRSCVTLRCFHLSGMPPDDSTHLWIKRDGKKVGSVISFQSEVVGENNPIEFFLFRTIKRLSVERHELEHKISTLGGETPEVWGYVDFLYFSTICQTTVGFGDIVPNCTLVRGVVVAQIIVGYFLIAIYINF